MMNRIEGNTREYESTEVQSQLTIPYSVGIFFNSSESRALAYRKLFTPKLVTVALLVDFDGGENEDKKNNYLINNTALLSIANKLEILKLNDIFDYQNNLDQIAAYVTNNMKDDYIRNVFIDITGAPLIYSVALIKFLFRMFPAPSVSILNVSGRYSLRGEEQFSEGEQFDMYIPGYYGTPDHSLPQHYIFLLGYDGERSLNIYRDNLPEKTSVIVPSPGYDVGYDTSTINNNREFLMETGFVFREDSLPKNYSRNRNIYYIDISDIYAVQKQIEKIYDEDKEKYKIRLVPLGPKPHAIGAALAAVFNNDISIMYQVPRKYYMSEIPAGDKMWLYDLNVSY